MTIGKLWPSKANVIVPYKAVTKQTKQVDISSAVTGTNWSNTRAVAIFYADSAGVWRMTGNIGGQLSSQATAIDLIITGIAAKASTVQAVDAHLWHSTNGHFATSRSTMTNLGTTNTNLYAATPAGDNLNRAEFSFDVELNAEPTTYTTSANMESFSDISVYIEPASAGVSGIVNNLAGNTKGTPILGKTDGVAVAAGYVGEVKSGTGTRSFSNNTGAAAGWNLNGNETTMTLGAGTWHIDCIVQASSTSGTMTRPASILFGNTTNDGWVPEGNFTFIPGAAATVGPILAPPAEGYATSASVSGVRDVASSQVFHVTAYFGTSSFTGAVTYYISATRIA